MTSTALQYPGQVSHRKPRLYQFFAKLAEKSEKQKQQKPRWIDQILDNKKYTHPISFSELNKKYAQKLFCNKPVRTKSLNRKKVIIIGAGFAGMAAAYELFHADFDVEIIEARNRVGGRVKSDSSWMKDSENPVESKVFECVEHGAELVGDYHYIWKAFANHLGLKLEYCKPIEDKPVEIKESDEAKEILVVDGKKIIDEQAERLLALMDEFAKMLSDDAKDIIIPDPLDNKPSENQWKKLTELDHITLEQKIEDFLKDKKLKDSEEKNLLKKVIRAYFLHDNGLDPTKQSYLFNILNVKGGGGDKFFELNELYRCKTGNQSLATSMLDSLKKKYKEEGYEKPFIHFNEVVTVIDTTQEKIYVTTKSGKVFSGDYVVCSVPSAIMDKITFKPELKVKVKGQITTFSAEAAIQNGYLYKYIMKTPTRFWLKQGNASALTDKYGEFWDGISSEYDNETMINKPGVLVAYAAIDDPNNDKDIPENIKKAIRDFIGDDQWEPLAYVWEQWYKEQYTKCGFSCPNTGLITSYVGKMLCGLETKGKNNNLDPRVTFAGEHTAFGWTGFMEGALFSGVRAAHVIHHRNKDKPRKE